MRAFLASIVVFAFLSPATAQEPEDLLFDRGVGAVSPDAGAGAGPAVQDPATAQAPAPPSPRLLAVRQAVFDRRPSTMLTAWAAPELEPLPAEPPADFLVPVAPGPAGVQPAPTGQPGSDGNPSGVIESPAEPAIGRTASGGARTSAGTSAARTTLLVPGRPIAPLATGTYRPSASGATAAGGPPPDDPNATPSPVVVPEATPPTVVVAATPVDPRTAAWEQKRIAREIEILKRDVTLGRWDRVAAWVGELAEPERIGAYEQVLRVLPNTPPEQKRNNAVPANLREQNRFSFDDVFALWTGAPAKLERKHVELLVPIVQRSIADGHVIEELVARLRTEVESTAEDPPITRRSAAWLMAKLGLEAELDGFLPTLEEAVTNNDREGLNLLARLALAAWGKDKKPDQLERAWVVTQAALAAGDISDEEKADALRRAVEIAPKVREELGDTWLAESFTSRPERGMEVIATIGRQSARGFEERMSDPAFRQTGLELQKTAVEALLAAAPERAEAWRQSLAILAENWMSEAQHAYRYSQASTRGPIMRRDSYGNTYWTGNGGYNPTPVQPIEPGELLEVMPSGRWHDLLDESLKPRFAMIVAQLFLKVNEEGMAFPYIEELAATHLRNAKELAAEFMRVWIRNHNPNSSSQNTNQYMFMYGFESRANGIPLTRSQQERNLADLAKWVGRLRALPIDALDESQLVNAFTNAHSSAEVYQLDSIEAVFGKLEDQKPETLADLVQHMRANLANVWRRPSTQEDKKTRRRQQDIEREVLRGYEVCRSVIEKAIADRGEHWKLVLAFASVLHDENNFGSELGRSSDFVANRKMAMELFAHAAELYAAGAPALALDEESTEAFETWFYATLGACDLGAVKPEHLPDRRQPERIKAALAALPGEAGVRHRSRFANLLFNRMSAVNPAVKSRYLEAGFEIVGDDPQAAEARRIYDYYQDLITELKLVTEVDGDTSVGWKQPFGLRVNIVHTKEIERESGGFGKYLQNQNNQSYAYNYGRPLEDYRDKFQESATQALQEQFEILSVTFNAPDVNSKDTENYGWRVTPYAYLLLKARGPEVDKIPQLHLDFDFLDTSGYAVLPITSAVLPIDASATGSGARPYEELEIVQTLDERQAKTGKLSLEIKATARGLVPDLDAILDLSPEEFTVDKSDDGGVSIASFDEDHERVVSERTWTVSLKAKEALGTAATKFQFGAARDSDAKVTRQRYDDADLAEAAEVVTLGERIGEDPFPWWWIALPLVLLLGGGAFVVVRGRGRGALAASRHTMPDHITPFTVLGLLRGIARENHVGDRGQSELETTIAHIERFFFHEPDGAEPDLRAIAEDWVRRAG